MACTVHGVAELDTTERFSYTYTLCLTAASANAVLFYMTYNSDASVIM